MSGEQTDFGHKKNVRVRDSIAELTFFLLQTCVPLHSTESFKNPQVPYSLANVLSRKSQDILFWYGRHTFKNAYTEKKSPATFFNDNWSIFKFAEKFKKARLLSSDALQKF